MGRGIAFLNRRTTDAEVTQRRCFASVTPKGEQLTHRILGTEADWRGTVVAEGYA
jgi:hypothetical protein